MPHIVRIRSAEPLDGYRVQVVFTDGTSRQIDLGMYLHGPIFDPIRSDPDLFRSLKVDPRFGTIVWPNGADIDPDVLYEGE